MTADQFCFWMRGIAFVAALLGGASGAVVGVQKAAAVSVGQSPAAGSSATASLSSVLDLGFISYYAVVGAFVGLALVCGPLILFECRRFARIREDLAMATRMKVQQALHDAETHAAAIVPDVDARR